MDDAESIVIKELYDSVAGPNSASYEVFRKKLHRLLQGNVRTTNKLLRNAGVEVPRPKEPSREFVGYDGEGWDGKYTLLANSLGEYIANPDGLSTTECLEFLVGKYDQPMYRVWFGFSYDVNNILRDLSDDEMNLILRGRSVIYNGYRVSYKAGKVLTVNGYNFYDVFGFFQTSFLNVVRTMLGPDRVTESLREGKQGRGSFDTWDMEKIIKYNEEELALLVEIMEKLKRAFLAIDVDLRQWYGPGAVAKYWFKKHNVLPIEKHTSGSIMALNDAYYGGRFEQVVLGKVKNVYEYDIHSAYPSVMVDMPNFRSWRHVHDFADDPYSIWHVTFDLRDNQRLAPKYSTSPKPHSFLPLPVRARDGTICFPMVGKGWYWYPEIKVLLDYFPDAKLTVHEGYRANTEGRPFAWVKEYYDYRRQLKAEGNLSQYCIKVGLNSLYGKTAQRSSKSPYFSLAWAGYITASARAKLARAAYEADSEHILGFATDALFSDKPLNLPLSDELGDWEESHFKSAIFFQSGIYRLETFDGTIEDRYRGAPNRRGIDTIIDQLQKHPNKYPVVRIRRFISNALAINAKDVYGPLRLKFVDVAQKLALDATYKRHYEGFTVGYKDGAIRIQDFSRLLKHKITSTPKVFVDDDHWLLSYEYLWDGMPLKGIESNPPPMKDANTQRLLEEAELLALEESSDDAVAVVEDEML